MFPKNRFFFPPKWMVYFMENPIKIDDLGKKKPIFGNTHIHFPVFMLPASSPKVGKYSIHGASGY